MPTLSSCAANDQELSLHCKKIQKNIPKTQDSMIGNNAGSSSRGTRPKGGRFFLCGCQRSDKLTSLDQWTLVWFYRLVSAVPGSVQPESLVPLRMYLIRSELQSADDCTVPTQGLEAVLKDLQSQQNRPSEGSSLIQQWASRAQGPIRDAVE